MCGEELEEVEEGVMCFYKTKVMFYRAWHGVVGGNAEAPLPHPREQSYG